MRWSTSYIPTLKEAPADAEVISHQLLIRAGMVRKVTSGIYIYLPLGLKVLEKAKNIIRTEMNKAGAQELLLPAAQPADLWQETGRWEFYGKELLRFKDRHDRDYCLGPTHEEIITDLVRGEVRSYRQLPMNLYQIQTKFRDEIRPRFGLLRGREFMMKDAYSFDATDEGADISYKKMFEAYTKTFSHMALKFRAVEADSGSIGGNFSHEFMVLADTGEDTIAACTACSFAANIERAAVLWQGEVCTDSCPEHVEVSTPQAHTVEEVCAFMHIEPSTLIKTLLFDVDGQGVAVLVRGDHSVNDVKLKNFLNATVVEMASPEQVEAWTKAKVGYAGPVGLDANIKIYADAVLQASTDWVCGANKSDTHLKHVSLSRDCKVEAYADFREILATDPCPQCGGALDLPKGIEVGHIFKLGTKYSEAMKATFLDSNGKEQVMIMGCYGIGVSRVVAACIEQNHDENGIVFPPPLAPFDVHMLNLDSKSDDVCAAICTVKETLEGMGLEVLLDDREERPGVKFKDADLLGMPLQICLGGKSLARGVLEAKDRRTGEKVELSLENFATDFSAWQSKVLAGWGL